MIVVYLFIAGIIIFGIVSFFKAMRQIKDARKFHKEAKEQHNQFLNTQKDFKEYLKFKEEMEL